MRIAGGKSVRDDGAVTVHAEDAPPVTPDALDGAAQADAPAPPRPKRRGISAASLLIGRGWVAMLVVCDFTMLMLALAAALIGAEAANIETNGAAVVWLFPPLVVALLAVRGLYRHRITLRILDEAGHVVGACSVAAMIIIALTGITTSAASHVELVARTWFFGMVYVGGGRLVLGLAQRRARVDGVVGTRTLILGAGRIGALVERRLADRPELGLRPVGYVDAHPPGETQAISRRLPVLGGPADLERIAAETEAKHVVLAFLSSRGSDATLVPIVRKCEELGLEVSLVPRLFESMNVRVGLEHIGGMPLFRMRSVRPKGWEFAIKHALDRALAAIMILFLSPLLIALTLAVKLSSPGPVFFRQRRVGRDGRDFDLLKFRSMRIAEDPALDPDRAVALPADTAPGGVEGGVDRRTPIGRLIRRTSLDELPQLLNVVRGEMSIVGPRPERPEYAALFEQQIARYDDRQRVKAGITGWAQVHGLRGQTSLSDRIEWDNYYIENWSLRLDAKILIMTIATVLKPAE
jgi:exopolysaccharide biosynthesis polyprenyl glycosylphosphotransferase